MTFFVLLMVLVTSAGARGDTFRLINSAGSNSNLGSFTGPVIITDDTGSGNGKVGGVNLDHIFNVKSYGAACSSATMTGTMGASSSALTVSALDSSFIVKNGVEVPQCGAASGLAQPAAPTVTAAVRVISEPATAVTGTVTPVHTALIDDFVSYAASGASMRRVNTGQNSGTYLFATGLYTMAISNTPTSLRSVLLNYWEAVPSLPADWAATHINVIGDIIKPTTNNAGNYLFKVSSVGCASAGAAPVWSQTVGNTTTDNHCTWTTVGVCDAAHGCTAAYSDWTASTVYFAPQFLKPSANNAGGFIIKLTATGTAQTGGAAPTFSQVFGNVTTDNEIKWTNINQAATSYTYEYAWTKADKSTSQASSAVTAANGSAILDASDALVVAAGESAPAGAIGICWWRSTDGGSTFGTTPYWSAPLTVDGGVPSTTLIDRGTAIGRNFAAKSDPMCPNSPPGAGGQAGSLYAKITAIAGTNITLDTASTTACTSVTVSHDETPAIVAAIAAEEANVGGVVQFPKTPCNTRPLNGTTQPTIFASNKPTQLILQGTNSRGTLATNLVFTASSGAVAPALEMGVRTTLLNLSVGLAPTGQNNGTAWQIFAPTNSSSFNDLYLNNSMSGNAENADLITIVCCTTVVRENGLQALVRHQIIGGSNVLTIEHNNLGFQFDDTQYLVDLQNGSLNQEVDNNTFEEGPNYLRLETSVAVQGGNSIHNNYFSDTIARVTTRSEGPYIGIALGTVGAGHATSAAALATTDFTDNFLKGTAVFAGNGLAATHNTFIAANTGDVAVTWQDPVGGSRSSENVFNGAFADWLVDKATNGNLAVGSDYGYTTVATNSYDFSQSSTSGQFNYDTFDDNSTNKIVISPQNFRTEKKCGNKAVCVDALSEIVGQAMAAPSGVTGLGLLWYDSTANRWTIINNNGAAFSLGAIVASGTSAMGTGAIAATSCAVAVTTAAANAATTDAIEWSFNAAPGAGYTSGLHVLAYLTSANVNFLVCNPTAGALTPAAATLNWVVVR